MPDIDKLLKQNNANFKRYIGIEKATFEQMLEAMTEHEANKTKSGRLTSAVNPVDLNLGDSSYAAWR